MGCGCGNRLAALMLRWGWQRERGMWSLGTHRVPDYMVRRYHLSMLLLVAWATATSRWGNGLTGGEARAGAGVY